MCTSYNGSQLCTCCVYITLLLYLLWLDLICNLLPVDILNIITLDIAYLRQDPTEISIFIKASMVCTFITKSFVFKEWSSKWRRGKKIWHRKQHTWTWNIWSTVEGFNNMVTSTYQLSPPTVVYNWDMDLISYSCFIANKSNLKWVQAWIH